MRLLRVCLLSCSAALLGASVQGTAGATQLPGEYDCLIEARQSIDMRSPVEGIIESVLVQDHPDIEHIVVDGASHMSFLIDPGHAEVVLTAINEVLTVIDASASAIPSP